MKYFYSFYSGYEIDDEHLFFIALSIKLSSTLIRKSGRKIGIYSDTKFIEILKKYEIELDFYENIENEIKPFASKKLFAVPKFYSNIIQTEPFIQIDIDLFLFDNFDYDLLESSKVSFYNMESIGWETSPIHYMSWKTTYLDLFHSFCDKYPNIIKQQSMNPLIAYNCAMVGGTDWKTFVSLYEPIYNILKENQNYLENAIFPSTALEQHIITGYLNECGYDYKNINFVSSNRIPYLEVEPDKFTFNITPDYKLDISNKTNLFIDNIKAMQLIKEKFEGTFHLQGAKGLLAIRNLIYEMLKHYDSSYVIWLEKNFGKKYNFQKNIMNPLI